jgi:arylsulfatase A-like enzyme
MLVLTSDHGESLGEHGYYFDHGEDLFDPCLSIPLIVVVPGAPAGGRADVFASTLDLLPTVLDTVKVSYPPDLAGTSLLPAITGAGMPPRDRLFAQNDRNLSATWTPAFKLVSTPTDSGEGRLALYDLEHDRGETRDVSARRPDDLRVQRRELDLFLERGDKEWAHTRTLLGGVPGAPSLSPEACEKLRALNYVLPQCR